MSKLWHERYPGRYQKEIDSLEVLGIVCKVDEPMMEKGLVRFQLRINGDNPHLDLPDKGQSYELTVVFPDNYPWFRPEVYAYGLNLPRHQHPGIRNLCLLPRGTRFWDPTWTIADLLTTQLGLVLEKGNVTDYEVVKADDSEQAEPVSEYYNVSTNAPVLFDPSNIDLTEKANAFRPIGTIRVGLPKDAVFPSRMAVLETRCIDNKVLHKVFPEVVRMFSYKEVHGLLIEAPIHPPITDNPLDILAWLKKGLAESGHKLLFPKNNIRLTDGTIKHVVGICFPEEVKPGVEGKGWLFVIEGTAPQRDFNQRIIDGKAYRDAYYLARPAYVSTDAKRDRVPRLLPLADKIVTIIGLGALGGFAAIELARSGVKELRLVDFDTVDPPTTVRWPLGVSVSGLNKTQALGKFIQENYPSTKILIRDWRIGSIRIHGSDSGPFIKESEQDVLEELLDGTSLLMDATAEEGINYYLSSEAEKRKLPYVVMYATPGAWGGVVMRVIPGETDGCWYCMKFWQEDNEKLVPPVDFQGMIQPPGCGDYTFTGASFDLQQISLAGVRMIVSTLASKEANGYSALPWDWAVLSLVDSAGNPTTPRWQEQKLVRHPQCPNCANK